MQVRIQKGWSGAKLPPSSRCLHRVTQVESIRARARAGSGRAGGAHHICQCAALSGGSGSDTGSRLISDSPWNRTCRRRSGRQQSGRRRRGAKYEAATCRGRRTVSSPIRVLSRAKVDGCQISPSNESERGHGSDCQRPLSPTSPPSRLDPRTSHSSGHCRRSESKAARSCDISAAPRAFGISTNPAPRGTRGRCVNVGLGRKI